MEEGPEPSCTMGTREYRVRKLSVLAKVGGRVQEDRGSNGWVWLGD